MTGAEQRTPIRIITYDRSRFDFAGLLRAALSVDDLDALTADTKGERGWSIYKAMERSASYRIWWDVTGSSAFAALYSRFVCEVVTPLFDDAILVQSCPTPRIVHADQAGEPRFHRDLDYGHDPREVNFQVVLTPAFASNAMWLESAPGKGDYRPVEYGPGEMLMFDGANLSHGAVPNRTGRSRVSFDFRAIRTADASPAHLEAADGETRGAHVFAAFA